MRLIMMRRNKRNGRLLTFEFLIRKSISEIDLNQSIFKSDKVRSRTYERNGIELNLSIYSITTILECNDRKEKRSESFFKKINDMIPDDLTFISHGKKNKSRLKIQDPNPKLIG